VKITRAYRYKCERVFSCATICLHGTLHVLTGDFRSQPHNTSIIRQCRRYYDLVSNIRHSAKLEASRKMESLFADI